MQILKCLLFILMLSSTTHNNYPYQFEAIEVSSSTLRLEKPLDTCFCIPTTLPPKYIKASINALETASQLDGLNLRYFFANKCLNAFKFNYEFVSSTYNAINQYSYNEYFEIVASTIIYNDFYMRHYSQAAINYIALHELGHTLGLEDISDPKIIGKSVMYYAYAKGDYIYTNYLKWDKYYLTQLYGHKNT